MLETRSIKPYIIAVPFTEAVGFLAGLLTRTSTMEYMQMAKPALTPPAIVFPIVWTVLYFLMGIGVARIYLAPASDARTSGLILYLLQLAFNFFWSIIFFNLQAYGFALAWIVALWLLILVMILTWKDVDRIAAYLQLPYFLWVSFATYLTYAVWMLNRS